MKTFFNIFFAFSLSVSVGYSQNIGINTDGSPPDASSMLDIVSTDKGLLIPRVSIPDLGLQGPITGTPVTSLLVYNESGVTENGYYYWDAGSTKWIKLLDTKSNSGLPVYTDNTAAASLAIGTFYRTPTGVVMVRY
jgi:hypothetical protein